MMAAGVLSALGGLCHPLVPPLPQPRSLLVAVGQVPHAWQHNVSIASIAGS